MTVIRKHGLYYIGFGATLLGGITRQSVRTGTQVRGEASSGEVWRRMLYVTAQAPGAAFQTLAIAAGLDLLGTIGVGITGLSGGFSVYAQKHASESTRAGATSHRKHNALAGIVVPTTIQCAHQGDATLDGDALFTWDGTHDPVTISDSQTLPAATGDDQRFTLGPATLGGVSLPQARSLTITFGINAMAEGADSQIWPTFASIVTVSPELRLKGIDVEWFKAANIPLAGKAIAHATTAVYLRKRSADGTGYVADATAEHIKFTACGLAYVDTPFDASGEGAAECSLVVPLKYDGINAPLIVDTTSAIV